MSSVDGLDVQSRCGRKTGIRRRSRQACGRLCFVEGLHVAKWEVADWMRSVLDKDAKQVLITEKLTVKLSN